MALERKDKEVNISRLVGLLVLWFAPFAASHAITAVCKEPVGHALGVHGATAKGKAFDVPDGMKGGTITIVWKKGQKEAQIVSQGSGGGSPNTETGMPILESAGQVSFLVLYSGAVWIYSLYPELKVLLISSHHNGGAFDAGGAFNKSFKASCEISES